MEFVIKMLKHYYQHLQFRTNEILELLTLKFLMNLQIHLKIVEKNKRTVTEAYHCIYWKDGKTMVHCATNAENLSLFY